MTAFTTGLVEMIEPTEGISPLPTVGSLVGNTVSSKSVTLPIGAESVPLTEIDVNVRRLVCPARLSALRKTPLSQLVTVAVREVIARFKGFLEGLRRAAVGVLSMGSPEFLSWLFRTVLEFVNADRAQVPLHLLWLTSQLPVGVATGCDSEPSLKSQCDARGITSRT
jgi:hypothetical protein